MAYPQTPQPPTPTATGISVPQPTGYGSLYYPTQGQMQPDPFNGRFGNNPGLLSYLLATGQPQWGQPGGILGGNPATNPPGTNPGAPPPTGQPGAPGTPGAGGMPPPWGGGGSHAGGGGGQFGGGSQQAAADAAARNTAADPSLRGALSLASSFAGPLGAMGLLGQLGLSQFGIGSNPFAVSGSSLSPQQQAMIANSIQGLPDSTPAVVKANMINNAIANARTQANSGIGPGGAGPGSLGGGAWGGFGSDSPGGQARAAAAAAGRGSGAGDGGGGRPAAGSGGLKGGGRAGF